MNIFIKCLLLVGLFSCNNKTGNKAKDPVIVQLPPIESGVTVNENTVVSKFVYDLKSPDQSWKLPKELAEVSGNAWVDQNHLILIEDLHPNLYLIKTDDKTATLEKTISFQKDQKDKFDIEDVTMIGQVVYALWSHGTLFRINDWNTKPDVEEMPTSLSKANNTEGVCYDPVTKNLLIACKGESGIADAKKSTKAVYKFDPITKKLDQKPFLVINKKDFEKLANDKISFNPSAIAVHPITHEIYLLSTLDNKCMAVYNRNGQLVSFQFIDAELMPQPEGICFSPEGKLYISSEGKKGNPGNLFAFDVK
ncbi:MAG: SdiA-regulated domain-containing protein [Ginsengibacter sp.]